METIVELPEKSSGIITTIQPSALPSSAHLPNQQKKKINRRISRALSNSRRRLSSAGSGEWPFDDEDLVENDYAEEQDLESDDDDEEDNIPYTQMLVNRDQLKRKYHQIPTQHHHLTSSTSTMKGKHDSVGENDTTEKGKHLYSSSSSSSFQHGSRHNQQQQQLNNVYEYYVETYESFGAVSCIASNSNGHSQPCWYHLQPAGESLLASIFLLCLDHMS